MSYAQTGTIPRGGDIAAARKRALDLVEWEQDPTGNQKSSNQKKGNKQMNQKQSNPRRPETVDELFPSEWLCADDLRGRPYTLTISHIEFDLFPIHPKTQEKTTKAVVRFERAQKALILNQTQARQIEEIAGSGSFADWPGTRVTLAPGRAPNNKPTIVIGRPPAEAMAHNAQRPQQDQASDTAVQQQEEKVTTDRITAVNLQETGEEPSRRLYRFLDREIVPNNYLDEYHWYQLVNGDIPHSLSRLKMWIEADANSKERDPSSFAGRFASGGFVPANLREYYEQYLEDHHGQLPENPASFRHWIRSLDQK